MKMQAFSAPRGGAKEAGARAMGIGGCTLLALATAAEVCGAVPEAQARGFFLSLGKRMAALETLEGVTDVAALAARIDGFWSALEWGRVEIEPGSDGFAVRHRGLPLHVAPDPAGHWAMMLAAVLEGAYDSWFRSLGSGPALHTRSRWNGDVLELHHGR